MLTIKLRQDTVRTLPYQGSGGKHQCIYWDQALENLGVRVYPSGTRTYVCSYRVRRRKRLAKIGRVTVVTLDQARKKAMKILGKVADNEDPKDESDKQRELKTVEQLCLAYVENHAKKKKKTWKSDQSMLDRHIRTKLGARLAIDIASADIELIHAAIGADYPYAANALLEVVRKMFNWGEVAGYVPKGFANPTKGIVLFPKRKRRRYITTAEMPRYLEALELEDSDYARNGLWLLLLMGLRSSELLNAKWVDIDWHERTLFIGLTKNGEPLLAPISDAAMARLKQIPRIHGNPYIICGGKPGSHLFRLGDAHRRVLERAGLQGIRVHDLRRTVGSWLVQSGQTLHLTGEILNHRDPKTTAGYAYFQVQHRRDALTAHGERVLKFGRSQPNSSTVPQDAETLLPMTAPESVAPSNTSSRSVRHYFKREQLYEIVWTAPVLEIARRLGVSDVAVAKLCRRANIPVPPRGYWARVEAGQHVPPTPLPPAPAGLPNLLRIRGRSASSVEHFAVAA